MPNQTIMAVPTNFKNLGEVKIFLSRLVQNIDIIRGYRNSATPININNTIVNSISDADYATITALIADVQVEVDANELILTDLVSDVTTLSTLVTTKSTLSDCIAIQALM